MGLRRVTHVVESIEKLCGDGHVSIGALHIELVYITSPAAVGPYPTAAGGVRPPGFGQQKQASMVEAMARSLDK